MSEQQKVAADLGTKELEQGGDDLSTNVHNEHVYYSNDAWSNDRDEEEIKAYKPGTEDTGDYALNNKNPAMMNGFNYGSSRHDELEQKKLPYQPANTKKFTEQDLQQVNNGFFRYHADLNSGIIKEARIVKTPNKEEYKILSEKGKTLGTYKSRKQAEERLKQIEMFKHMKKKADYFDWKGQQNTEEKLGTPEKIVPADDKRVKPYAVPETPTSSTNVPGMNQDDGALAVAESVDKAANVVGDVKGKGVTPDVKDGSSGFSATRGVRSARSSEQWNFAKEAATRINTVPVDKTRHQDLERNDQTPYNADGKGCFSYSPQEKKDVKGLVVNMQPVNTAIPGNLMDRLYDVDTEKMVEGTEFGTWDIFITPTNQNVEIDSLSNKEKQYSKENKNNKKF